jgi:hypothetical protein
MTPTVMDAGPLVAWFLQFREPIPLIAPFC